MHTRLSFVNQSPTTLLPIFPFIHIVLFCMHHNRQYIVHGTYFVVSADTSSFGLDAVLLQKQLKGELRPIAHVSRTMTPTEKRYAQIEKEALALTWACERFSDYLIYLQFHLQTDHKPLVPLLSNKNLDKLPIRVQRFRRRLMRYSFIRWPGRSRVRAAV